MQIGAYLCGKDSVAIDVFVYLCAWKRASSDTCVCVFIYLCGKGTMAIGMFVYFSVWKGSSGYRCDCLFICGERRQWV